MRARLIFSVILLYSWFINGSHSKAQIRVRQDGSGDFSSIQAAIDFLAADTSAQQLILIGKGTYREKVFIEKSKLRLKGEGADQTFIVIAEAREIWRCTHPDDWGVAALNIRANDVIVEDLSIINNYASVAGGDSLVYCPLASPQNTRLVKKETHQMAVRAMAPATRLIFKNCTFRSGAGDTVSPWDTQSGMYYFLNCTFEGGVDFYCPRGWAYAENCRFICLSRTAGIWHDGSGAPDAKTVLKKCTFEGVQGFKLGRYHREAQFYLIDCQFADTMDDTPIYHVSTAPDKVNWGERIYYHGCRKEGKPFAWYEDRLPDGVKAGQIDFTWTFGGKWQLPGF